MPLLASILLLASCATTTAVNVQQETAAVNRVVDDWHEAAAQADEARYFAHAAPDFVFLGTDATERWDLASFRAFAHPYFAKGTAWTFVPQTRHVALSPDGTVAWFDESLSSASYGECRGSGVLRRIGGEWKIAQYNLTIPIPNALAKEFVARIRATSK
jgi:ketosteroid isomerase-like protein